MPNSLESHIKETKDEKITNFLNIKFINGIKRIIKLQGSWGGIKRTIILVGEYHGNEECYESKNATINRKQIINYIDFYRTLFQFNSDLKTPNAKFIDFFIEAWKPSDKHLYNLVKIQHPLHQSAYKPRGIFYLDALRDLFLPCMNTNKKDCKYNNVRVHWNDTRNTSNYMFDIINVKKEKLLIDQKIIDNAKDKFIKDLWGEEYKKTKEFIDKNEHIMSENELLLLKLWNVSESMNSSGYNSDFNRLIRSHGQDNIFEQITIPVIDLVNFMIEEHQWENNSRDDYILRKRFDNLHDALWRYLVEDNSIIASKILLQGSSRGYDKKLYNKIKQYYKQRFINDYFSFIEDIINDKCRWPFDIHDIIHLYRLNHSYEVRDNPRLFIVAGCILTELFWTNIMDTYNLMRMFKKFIPKSDENKINTNHPKYATNIIVHAGEAHIESYRDFLTKDLNFKESSLSIHTYKSRRKDKWVPHESDDCVVIDTKNIIDSQGRIIMFDDPVSGGFILPKIPPVIVNNIFFIGVVVILLFMIIVLCNYLSSNESVELKEGYGDINYSCKKENI